MKPSELRQAISSDNNPTTADADDVCLAVAAGRRAREGEAYLATPDGVHVIADPLGAEARAALVMSARTVMFGGVGIRWIGGVS